MAQYIRNMALSVNSTPDHYIRTKTLEKSGNPVDIRRNNLKCEMLISLSTDHRAVGDSQGLVYNVFASIVPFYTLHDN